ncbi:MAG: alpha-ketoacid dehydrogenase subunit beta [Candidatus Latescibacterota bacterium]|nr:alpha-ketoacid dehydrogenase subunit beta [Candidatus Latescibacterota bacterium]
MSPREISYTDAAREALAAAMERDPTIFILGEGIGERGGNFNTTVGLYERFGPMRLRDTPICERGFTGICTGAAMTGTRPVIDFMIVDFILDGVGELVNQMARIQYLTQGRLKMPVLIRGCFGIGSGYAAHHSGNYYSLFVNIPGFHVVLPTTPYDAKGLMATALRSDNPVIYLENKSLLNCRGPVPEEDYTIPFGEAVIRRLGSGLTVVAVGAMVPLTLSVCDDLASEGIEVELIDPRTLAPLDLSTILESLAKTGRLLVVDESFGPCGIGAEISARVMELAFNDLDAPVRRLNGEHTPTPYSPTLEAAVIPSAARIADAIRNLAAD